MCIKNIFIPACCYLLMAKGVSASPPVATPQPTRPSGIYGQVMLYRSTAPGIQDHNNDGYVPNCDVVLYRASDHHEVMRVKANAQGRFTMTTEPGKYIIAPIYPKDSKVALGIVEERPVTVWRGFRTYAEATFDGGW